MAINDRVFAGSIPEFYERYLVPLIFEPYALDLARRLENGGAERVLEIAAGTGVLTRALAARLGPNARITATDLNEPMLAHAKTKLSQDTRVSWQQADAQALPFEDRSFDVVVCQFGAMFFPDKVRAFREARRVLKPGRRYYVSVWGKISDNEFADVVTETLAEMFPDDPPRFLARTPHGHYDVDRLGTELKAAGFTEVSAEGIDARSKAPSPREPAIAYVEGTLLRNEIEARDPARLAEATSRATDAIARRFGSGAVDGLIRAYVMTAQ